MDMLYMLSMWVKQCHLHHPPVITIFIGGMVTIPKWLVYGIVLPTLYYVFDPSDAKMRHEPRHPRDCSCPFGSAWYWLGRRRYPNRIARAPFGGNCPTNTWPRLFRKPGLNPNIGRTTYLFLAVASMSRLKMYGNVTWEQPGIDLPPTLWGRSGLRNLGILSNGFLHTPE